MTFFQIIGSMAAMTIPATTAPPAAPFAAAQADFARAAATIVDAAYPAAGPGAAIVVTRDGQPLYAAGRGLAELDPTRAITPDTTFRLGSITKQFTAAVILQLVDEGRVSLDDPLSRFLPGFAEPSASATVRQLLNHTSGIMDYSKIPGWMMSPPSLRPNSTADLVALMRDRPAVAKPGERWEYNNGGYTLLGAIIEQVTGTAWHEAVITRIAKPLGLGTLRYAGDTPDADQARGYSLVDGRMQPSSGVHISVAHAAGGLVASAADLARWSQALHGGKVVAPALYKEMIAPTRMADGSIEPYGFGFRLREVRGKQAIVHGGAGRGIDTDAVYIPSDRLFVAVLANSDDPATDPSILTRRLAALGLGEPAPVFAPATVDPASLAPLFGAYSVDQGPPRRFFARDGKLYVGRGDEELEVIAAGDDRFYLADDPLDWFQILRKPDGAHVLKLHRMEAAAPDISLRTGPVPAAFSVDAATLRGYVGTYRTEGPLLVVTLREDGRLAIAQDGRDANALRPVSATEFRFEGMPMRIVFHPKGGRTDRFTLYRGARELHGQRTTP